MKTSNDDEADPSSTSMKNKFALLNELDQEDTGNDDESSQQSNMPDNQHNQGNVNRPRGKPPPIVVYAD